MRFSDRTDWETRTNRVTDVYNALKRSGEFIYDLTVSNPTRCGFQFFDQQFLNVLADERGLTYEPDPCGLLDARQAVVQYYTGQGIDIRPQQVFLTASTSEAYGFLFRLLVDPGRNVIFPKPSYPLFEFLSGIHDVDWRTYDLVYEDRWRLDERSFKRAIDGQTRAAILVNPNNPTGSCLKEEEIDALYQQCVRAEIPVICDEVFWDYPYSDHHDVRSLAGKKEQLTFVLNGVSKLLALPQMKCSWIVMSGPDDLVEEARRRLEIIADTYLSVNTPAQNALPVWMSKRYAIQNELLGRIRGNRSFLSEEVGRASGIELLNADGGWSAVVRCPKIDEESFILELLEEQKVFVHPGYFFDFQDSGYMVMSLLPKKDIFEEGVSRLIKQITGGRLPAGRQVDP